MTALLVIGLVLAVVAWAGELLAEAAAVYTMVVALIEFI